MAKFIEFPDGLGPSTPLFVQCRWLFDPNQPGLDTREIATTEPVCLLMMILGIEHLNLASVSVMSLHFFVSIVNFKLGMSDITLTLLLHGNKMKNSSVKNVFLSKCFFVGASLCGFNFRTLNLVREVIAFY